MNLAPSSEVTNNTAASGFYDWLMHKTNEIDLEENETSFSSPCSLKDVVVDDDDDDKNNDSQPSLQTVSDLDSSHGDISTCCSDSVSCDDGSSAQMKHRQRRSVSFVSTVEVREYAVTVGDHPFCYDGLPLTLDWQHSEELRYRNLDDSRERVKAYRLPRRMGYEERREKLFTVSAYTTERVRNEEIDSVIRMLQQSWSQNTILPMPEIEDLDNDDDDEDDDDDEEEEDDEEEDDDDDVDVTDVLSRRQSQRTDSKRSHKNNDYAGLEMEWVRVRPTYQLQSVPSYRK